MRACVCARIWEHVPSVHKYKSGQFWEFPPLICGSQGLNSGPSGLVTSSPAGPDHRPQMRNYKLRNCQSPFYMTVVRNRLSQPSTDAPKDS